MFFPRRIFSLGAVNHGYNNHSDNDKSIYGYTEELLQPL